jgi:hypothetical protein
MLQQAFYESRDYRTLLEACDAPIVVGRRGSGKSALMYKLGSVWEDREHTAVVRIVAEEDQVIGIRKAVEVFGETYGVIRGGMRIVWHYALLMELAGKLVKHYKIHGSLHETELRKCMELWESKEISGRGLTGKVRKLLQKIKNMWPSPEERVAELTPTLMIREAEDAVIAALERSNLRVSFLIDKLDEGYQADEKGIAVIGGIIHGTLDLHQLTDNIRAIAFLRDNIYRSFADKDPDYSRNVEGRVLRLHWEERELFYMLCKRLRLVFDDDTENDTRLWDKYTEESLHGFDGFKNCLRQTLYRPRDVLSLLNTAFHRTLKEDRSGMAASDVEATAHETSDRRLKDLFKEYDSVIPGLQRFVSVFGHGPVSMTVGESFPIIESALRKTGDDPAVLQDIALHQTPQAVISSLYGVGFLGIHSALADHFAFCHDGRNPSSRLHKKDRLLVHPCYWLALGMQDANFSQDDAEEIYDEYDILVHSKNPEIRIKVIDAILKDYQTITPGKDDAHKFENWCKGAVEKAFAGSLVNVVLRPNKNATSRRDVVGTNTANEDTWQWIREHYESRQVVFEAKNYARIQHSDIRQLSDYLHGEYGRIGFLICQDETETPRQKEATWIQEQYNKHNKLCIKLTGKFLCRILEKIKRPTKYSASEDQLGKLLDNYSRLYLHGQGLVATKRKRRQSKNLR